ncbi:MAG TPA: hypothetical protein ENJ21_01825 [Chromatiaceae bacterium]|nr:hypothetical protein [Chromatiaceae bacterium]
MNELPVLIVGPAGSGKSAAIRALCGDRLVRRQVVLADGDNGVAIGLETGELEIPAAGSLSLLAYPADKSRLLGRFIAPEMHAGVVLLIDGRDEAAIEELRHYLQQISSAESLPLAIGVTHLDLGLRKNLDALALQMTDFGLHCPLFRIDARQRGDVGVLLEALLLSMYVAEADGASVDRLTGFTEPLSSGFCS